MLVAASINISKIKTRRNLNVNYGVLRKYTYAGLFGFGYVRFSRQYSGFTHWRRSLS